MTLEGPELYDQQDVLATYMAGRARRDNPNDTLELPVVLDLLEDVQSAHILDLGCGDARLGHELLHRGAAAYVGLDGSEQMCARARDTLAGTTGQITHAEVETWTYPQDTFSHVVARLVLHWVRDLDLVLSGAFRALRSGGRLILSVEHPVITSCDRAWRDGGPRRDWIVDDYFDVGERTTTWLGARVIKYHRTVEDYYMALQHAGFTVESLRESRPEQRYFEEVSTYERRRRIPLFLFLAGRKPAPPPHSEHA